MQFENRLELIYLPIKL